MFGIIMESSEQLLEMFREGTTNLHYAETKMNKHSSRAHFFSNISEHADGERRGPVSIGGCLKTRSRRELPYAALRFDLALGVRRRHAAEICEKN